MMRAVILLTASAMVLAACGDRGLRSVGFKAKSERVTFDGERFKTKATRDKENREFFTVTIAKVSQSIDGAREAGRHAGTRYCIDNYGSSVIAWGVGPDDDPTTYVIDNDELLFDGECLG